MGLIKQHILNSDTIEMKEILRKLNNFKAEIKESIRKGERTYLPNASAKEMGAYKNPESEQSVRGVLAWNMLYPDNMIELPSKVSLVKLNIFKEDDILPLKETHPEIYDIIIEKIFHDTTGIFVQKNVDEGSMDFVNVKDEEWYKKIPKKFRSKYKKLGPEEWNKFIETVDIDDPKYQDLENNVELKVRGMQVLAIPSNALIPEWLQPYIDYATMINNILSPFLPVLDIFKEKTIEEGKSTNGVNRKTAAITNIIKF